MKDKVCPFVQIQYLRNTYAYIHKYIPCMYTCLQTFIQYIQHIHIYINNLIYVHLQGCSQLSSRFFNGFKRSKDIKLIGKMIA